MQERLQVVIGANINELNSALGQAQASVNKTTSNISSTLKNAGKVITGLGVAGAAGIGYVVKEAANFESQMSKVKAISGATGNDFKLLEQTARDAGATTAYSAK